MTNQTATLPTIEIFNAFRKWIAQRPGLEYGNYGEMSSYRAELRTIASQKRQALKALAEAETYPFDAAAMADSLQHSFSGRLEWTGNRFDYTTGQYWPTEYRIAAAVVLEAYCNQVRPKLLPQSSDRFTTIADIKAANKAAGGHWFDRDSMRFFKSRIYPRLFPLGETILFISSEQFDDNSPRKYSVRSFTVSDASIDTVGKFQAYMFKEDAIEAAKACQQAVKDGYSKL